LFKKHKIRVGSRKSASPVCSACDPTSEQFAFFSNV